MNEFRIFGPPGTGKTTRLATRDIPRAVEKYGPDKIMVTSFTRAAAKEIAFKRSKDTGKRIEVNNKHVGTMHSILYHKLGMPEIMEAHHIDKWNMEHPKYSISGGIVQSMDESCSTSASRGTGDIMLNAVNIKRNKMQDFKHWREDIQKFYTLWSEMKHDLNAVDFTDLIELGYKHVDKAPGEPSVIFVDEAQDFTQLQLSTIRKWGQHTEWIVLVGDDDQTIYEFTGATPDAFLRPKVDEKMKTVLGQSWRVPREILDRATNLIEMVSYREPKTYLPRMENGNEVMGEVIDLDKDYNDAMDVVDYAKAFADLNKTVMILGSCSYMLEPVKQELRKQAIPFQNRYRRRRRDWNPLYGHGTINDFLETGIDGDYWNIPQFVEWAKHLQVGNGTTGLKPRVGNKAIKRLKQAIEDNEDGLHTCREVIDLILTPQAKQAALNRDVDWYMKNVSDKKAKALEYHVAVYKAHGKDALDEEPKVTIGTIHSVKGAEADAVILFPDVSIQADIEMGSVAGNDSAHRLFYVGMTRAKETLVLLKPIVDWAPVPRLSVRM